MCLIFFKTLKIAQANLGSNYPNAEVGPLVYLNDRDGEYVSWRLHRSQWAASGDITNRAHCISTRNLNDISSAFSDRMQTCPPATVLSNTGGRQTRFARSCAILSTIYLSLLTFGSSYLFLFRLF